MKNLILDNDIVPDVLAQWIKLRDEALVCLGRAREAGRLLWVMAAMAPSILCDHRRDVIEALSVGGIPLAVCHPKPLHLQTPFATVLREGSAEPVCAESVSARDFILPMHPYLSEGEIERIARVVVKRPLRLPGAVKSRLSGKMGRLAMGLVLTRIELFLYDILRMALPVFWFVVRRRACCR